MRRTHLENHLLLFAQIERLEMASSAQVPNVHLMAVFAAEKQLRLQSTFDHVRRAPLAAQQRVETQMPPEIVMKKLRSAVHFPLAQNLERFTIEHENAARAVAIGRAERAHVNAFRTTVNRMWTRIISACENFFRLEHFNDLWFSRIGFCIDDVNARRAQAGHNQVTALDVWVRRIRAKRRAACIPTEMMQLITKLRHCNLADMPAIGARVRINVHNQQRVVEF